MEYGIELLGMPIGDVCLENNEWLANGRQRSLAKIDIVTNPSDLCTPMRRTLCTLFLSSP